MGPGRRVTTVLLPPGVAVAWAALVPTAERLLSPVHPAQLTEALATIAALLCLFTLASSVSFALASLYFSRDVEWLLATPVSARVFITHRLLSQLALGATVGALVGGPAVVGAALRYHDPLLIAVAAVDLPALLLVPMALAVLAVVLVVRLVPARRVRDAAAVLVALVGFGVAAVDLSAAFGGSRAATLTVDQFRHGLGTPAWLPPSWAAHSLEAAAAGHWGQALWPTLGLLTLAALVVPGSVFLAGPALREGWFRSQHAPSRSRSLGQSRRLPPALAVLRKDWRILRRDPGQLIQLLLPIGLFAVYLLSPRGGSALFRDFPAWYGPLTTAAFAALFATSGIGLRAVGSEGRQLWCVRSSPMRARDLLLSKSLLPALISVAASLVLLLATELRQGMGLAEVEVSAALLCFLVLGLAGLATGLGAAWPRLDWTDPRRSVGIWLAITFMVVGSAYIAVCVVAFTLPLLLAGIPLWLRLALALLTCALCATLAAGGALRAGTRRLAGLDL